MAALQCEICGGRLIGKPGGIFECDSCGTEYSTEWASAKIQEIKGTVKVEGTVQVAGTVTIEGGISTASLLKRGELALEDREWDNARKAFDRALDMDPENGHAYFGKLMAEYRVRSGEELSALSREFTSSANYQKALRFADEALSAKLEEILQIIEQREETERREKERREAEARKEEERRQQLAREKAAENQKKAQKQARTAAHAAKIALPIVAVIAALAIAIPMLPQKPEQEIPKATEVQMEVPVVTETTVQPESIPPETTYSVAEKLLIEGRTAEAAMAFYNQGDKDRSFELWRKAAPPATFCSASVALQKDGTVLTDYLDASDYVRKTVPQWHDVVSVDVGLGHVVGLKKDGTVIAVGTNDAGQCNVDSWKDIVAVAAGNEITVGLKSDGTVITAGKGYLKYTDYDTSDWEDIVAISAGQHVAGLKADGTVSASGDVVSNWSEIVAVDASEYEIFGVKADGTVVKTNFSPFLEVDVSGWTDIVDVVQGSQCAVGLKSNGTAVMSGKPYNPNWVVDVSDWENIVAISGGRYFVGLKPDGTVQLTGGYADSKTKAAEWTNIALPGELAMAK